MGNLEKVTLQSGSQSLPSDTAQVRTINYNNINPFVAEQTRTFVDQKVNFGLFNQNPELPDDSFRGKGQDSKGGNLFGLPETLFSSLKQNRQLNLEKLAPLQSDKFGHENPVERERKITLGKFLSALMPKKSAVGEIPDEGELMTAITAAYESSPQFRKIVDEIEYRGIS